MQNWMQIHCSTCSLIFNVMTTQVYMLIQQWLPPTMTSTVKLSLFMHAHSSPLFLAARLHWCHANHSHYINNVWTFSQTDLVYLSYSVILPNCPINPIFTSVSCSFWVCVYFVSKKLCPIFIQIILYYINYTL